MSHSADLRGGVDSALISTITLLVRSILPNFNIIHNRENCLMSCVRSAASATALAHIAI